MSEPPSEVPPASDEPDDLDDLDEQGDSTGAPGDGPRLAWGPGHVVAAALLALWMVLFYPAIFASVSLEVRSWCEDQTTVVPGRARQIATSVVTRSIVSIENCRPAFGA